jgi:mRNA-degrading endonuclease RelE of RelBE toxin-antitoxin system
LIPTAVSQSPAAEREFYFVRSPRANPRDWIPGVGAHVRKVRVGLKEARIAKRKGYRLIYYVDLEKSVITPLLFHYKPDIQLIPPKEIAKALKTMLEKDRL